MYFLLHTLVMLDVGLRVNAAGKGEEHKVYQSFLRRNSLTVIFKVYVACFVKLKPSKFETCKSLEGSA